MPERNWKQRMRKRILIRTVLTVLVLALAAAAVYVFALPYRNARSQMPENGVLTLCQLEDGTQELSWPAAEKADYYTVEVVHKVSAVKEEEPHEETLYSAEVKSGTACQLPQLPKDEELIIRVNTMVAYEFPGGDKVRRGSEPLETKVYLDPPAIGDLAWKADPDTDTVKLTFTIENGGKARLFYFEDGQWHLLKTLEAGEATVTFGEDGDLPMLAHGETCTLALDASREQEGSVYYSVHSDQIQVIREDLLDRNLWVQLQDLGDNMCTLVWNETKGEYYELQMLDPDTQEWATVCTVAQDGERSYTTGHLKAYRTYTFRVVAQGGQALPGTYAALSRTVEFETVESLLYTTTWPIKELTVYSDPELTESIGTVAGGQTLCILEVREGVFGIRYGDGVTGYIDSNYCMIDLAEYLGGLCSYQITNSYSSKYMINKYDIPKVTGKVIGGYENVRMADGTYLVPLLYPVAQRLLNAALTARDQGYRLKIYDAYRPNRATVMLYDTAEKLLEEPLPGNIVDPNADPDAEGDDRLMTYGKVMTDDGKYPLNYFLARGASLHNLGIALDLTIESLETGEEQAMQTKMHDLSYYSMLYRNNANANILAEIMESAGFGGLVSEWWHFQDNEIRNELTLPALWGGVSPEGWKLDDQGWRYRNADGTYAADCTLTLEGTEYTFDAQGYLAEQ